MTALGGGRTTDQANTYFGSEEFQRLDGAVGGAISRAAPEGLGVKHCTSVMSLGFEFVQPFSVSNRSTGVLVAR